MQRTVSVGPAWRWPARYAAISQDSAHEPVAALSGEGAGIRVAEIVEAPLDEAEEEDSALELASRVDRGRQSPDSTCVRLNMHYPTDWVLPRDATRTLMKATELIRDRRLEARMREPAQFPQR